jgi:hypothetical protein
MNNRPRVQENGAHDLRRRDVGAELAARNPRAPYSEPPASPIEVRPAVSIVGFQLSGVRDALPSECFVG